MADNRPWVDDTNISLFTDLYELTMAQAYVEGGMDEEATFSLFVRHLPDRNYLLACGLEDVLAYLESVRFSSADIDYLASLGHFGDTFLDWLRDFRFSGDVFAVPEGTPVFANEPMVEVSGPIAECQIAETYVMNQIHLQTVLASKASRIVDAAQGRAVVDFGPRRMHGTDAALKGARAYHAAGITATSNVLAGRVYGVPVTGTMAHSFIQACESELDAFRLYARLYPETILLVDSYDTIEGTRKVVQVAEEMGDDFKVRGIRLDSGDLAKLAFECRKILDDAGLSHLKIFASSGLDEYAITEIVAKEAPIDGFGIGTAMGVSRDQPGLDIAYKLCSYAGKGRLKLSTGKPILPGRKQIFRQEEDGRAVRDVIARDGEDLPGRPMLHKVMEGGNRLPDSRQHLETVRNRAKDELARLPDRLRRVAPADPPYLVEVSDALAAYQEQVTARIARG